MKNVPATSTIMTVVVFMAVLTLATLEYSYHAANAKNTIESSFNNCSNGECNTVTCMNNDCHTSVSNSTQQILNSTSH